MMFRPLAVALSCSVLLASCSHTLAQGPLSAQEISARQETPVGLTAMVIDDELRASLMRVLEIEDGVVIGEDRLGMRVRFEAGQLVALVRVSPTADVAMGIGVRDGLTTIDRLQVRAAGMRSGVLTTTDGRRYPGQLGVLEGSPSDDERFAGDSVIWIDGARVFEFALEQVGSVVLEGAPATVRIALPQDVASDTLLLTNGDVLEGFIASVGDEVVLERDDGGETRLGSERVHAMVLANPREEPLGVRVWFDDGAVLGGDGFVVDRGRWVSEDTDAPPAEWRALDGVRAVALDAQRLVALSALPVASGVVERVTHPDDTLLERVPALDARDLILDGASETVFTLPAGSERLACTLELERGNSAWADCEVVVLIDGVEAWRAALRGGASSTAMNIPLSEGAQELTIRVLEGRFGAIHDRVRLARPLLLTSR